tara:strand:- start:2199 stop:2450 length:252 start_codon:yes stop_codon:yes gene_type:complete
VKRIELETFVKRKKKMTSEQFDELVGEMFKGNVLDTATYLGLTWRQVYNYKNGMTIIPNPVALCLLQKRKLDKIPNAWLRQIQ